jgi:hypothetical protein
MFSQQKRAFALLCLSGLIYNAWILGYWLNPPAVHSSLVSNLQVTGQPHYLIFIILDLICSLFAVTSVWEIRSLYKKYKLGVTLTQVGLFLFAIGTALDALMPLSCPKHQLCTVSSNQFFTSHVLLNVIAMIGIFLSLGCCLLIRKGNSRTKLQSTTFWSISLVYVSWIILGLYFIYGAYENTNSIFAVQQVFLILTGVCLAGSGYLLYLEGKREALEAVKSLDVS